MNKDPDAYDDFDSADNVPEDTPEPETFDQPKIAENKRWEPTSSSTVSYYDRCGRVQPK